MEPKNDKSLFARIQSCKTKTVRNLESSLSFRQSRKIVRTNYPFVRPSCTYLWFLPSLFFEVRNEAVLPTQLIRLDEATIKVREAFNRLKDVDSLGVRDGLSLAYIGVHPLLRCQ